VSHPWERGRHVCAEVSLSLRWVASLPPKVVYAS